MFKDDEPHPVPAAWRPTIREIVRAFVIGDYALASGVAHVDSVSRKTETQIRDYIAGYGTTLVDLPEDTWSTSIVHWYGAHWELLIDLWTAEEGRSDLVLLASVRETDDGHAFTVNLVYVP